MRNRQQREEKPQKNMGPLRVWWVIPGWDGTWFTSVVAFDVFYRFLVKERVRGKYVSGRGGIAVTSGGPFRAEPSWDVFPAQQKTLEEAVTTEDPDA